ncbi:hypothetical protein F751_0225 [Auxenochlorella protothecoides]|uniref:Uncharacterized protein n=1 Tax=Auxenochlorella protothecoides TaxID=3075 RepID=A0A087SE87_AUXPR|nr:hypothetical protein F751_0225 [Auxenochlorella protothecoides]KFM24041.1 hypothetical protein F751_0225 [Auxenochlorella protothecoides]
MSIGRECVHARFRLCEVNCAMEVWATGRDLGTAFSCAWRRVSNAAAHYSWEGDMASSFQTCAARRLLCHIAWASPCICVLSSHRALPHPRDFPPLRPTTTFIRACLSLGKRHAWIHDLTPNSSFVTPA